MKTFRKSIALILLIFTGFIPVQVKPVYLIKSGGGLPSSFDWREQDIITPVKNQGNFKTCRAFASAGLVESLIKKETGKEVDLSEQELVSCLGEKGPFAGLTYIRDHGIVTESAFPYRGDTVSCPDGFDKKSVCRISSFSGVIPKGKSLRERSSLIKEAFYSNCPLVTTMNLMDDFRFYKTGIYIYYRKSEEQSGRHIILITEWQDDPEVFNGGYLIIKNSAWRH